MVTHKQHSQPDLEMQKIEQAIEELKARRKQLQSRDAIRTRLLRYCNEQGYTRADLFAVIAQMPKIRITRKDREARLKEVRNKHAPLKSKGKPELVTFGVKLRTARAAKGLSQTEVGKAIGKHPSLVGSWEMGKWRCVPENLAKLEKLYGVKLATNGG